MDLRLADIGRAVAELAAKQASAEMRLTAEEHHFDAFSKADLELPAGGMVWKLGASNGERIASGDTLAQVIDCGASFIVASIPQRQFSFVQVGSAARFRLGRDDRSDGTGLVGHRRLKRRDRSQPGGNPDRGSRIDRGGAHRDAGLRQQWRGVPGGSHGAGVAAAAGRRCAVVGAEMALLMDLDEGRLLLPVIIAGTLPDPAFAARKAIRDGAGLRRDDVHCVGLALHMVALDLFDPNGSIPFAASLGLDISRFRDDVQHQLHHGLYIFLPRTRSRSAVVDARPHSPLLRAPVDVFIATYNETRGDPGADHCLRTNIDHPDLRVWVLDDGARDWVRALAEH